MSKPTQVTCLNIADAPLMAPYGSAERSLIHHYRTALQQIASADLKRCSAGRLRDIAKKALGVSDAKG